MRKPPFLDELRALAPDVCVVVAYGKILPPEVLAAPRHGCLNVHASLLPKYRGAAPIQWAIIRGERETGVTLMQMDAGMDTGDMIAKRTLAIDEWVTAGQLHTRLAPLGAELLVDGLAQLKAGALAPEKQDNAAATMAPMLTKETGRVDFAAGARAVRDLVRGCDPWPTAYTSLGGEPLKLFRAKIVSGRGAPGVVMGADRDGLHRRLRRRRGGLRRAAAAGQEAHAGGGALGGAADARRDAARRMNARDLARRVLRRVDEGAYATLALAGELGRARGLSPADRGARHRADLRRLEAAAAARLGARRARAARPRQARRARARHPARRRLSDPVLARAGARRRRRRGRRHQARRARRSSANFANALLRALARAGEPPPPTEATAALGVRASAPDWLVRDAVARFGARGGRARSCWR